MGWLLDDILDWVAAAILASFDVLVQAITQGLLVTPQVTALPQVQALTSRSVWIVDTVFVLAFVTAGVLAIVAGGNEHARYTVKDLAPRLVVGFVAAHFSPQIVAEAITLANGLVAGLATGGQPGALDAIKIHVHAGGGQVPFLMFVAIAVIISMLVASTFFGMLVRLARLLVLTAAAPMALACHALRETDPLARLWWKDFGVTLAIPVLQAFTLNAGHWMLTDPAHLLPTLGLPVEPGGVVNLFVVMVLLWTTAKVPALVYRYTGQGGRGPTFLGAVARVVVVQQLTRRIPGLGRAVRVR